MNPRSVRGKPALVLAEIADGEIADGRKPRHREVFDTLLSEIASGRFQPGDRLPTEAELAKKFSASRSTVSRAMRDLKGRGLLNRARGGGTHVAKSKSGNRVALFAPFADTAAHLGYIGGQIHAHLSEVASWRTDHLRLQTMGRAIHREDLLDRMLAATQVLIEQGVNGVFYYPVELPQNIAHYNAAVVERLEAAGIAVIAVDRDIVAFPQRSKLSVVSYDNRRGGFLVTDHLIQRGCRRIVFVGSPFVSSAASDRMRGYFDALEESDIGHDRSMVFRADLPDIDVDFCRRLMETAKPDAIVCKMDHYAALICRHLVNLGVKIGDQVKVAGFDDEPFAEMLPVPLTTIRFPADPFAQVCYERLVAQMTSDSPPPAGMTLMDVELVVRDSTGG
ncbi:MAG: transcriptional regulator, GntR family [Phycisphaerales bacterium]|nr:transcriptional regulator, GntR family [Phycisphaerales bacterium]